MSTHTEDVDQIERAGRRCAVCRSGRGWRRFEVVRSDDREPVVLCGHCRAQFGDDPPVGRSTVGAAPAADAAAATEAAAAAEAPAPKKPSTDEAPREQRPDRLRVALGELPDPFSTAMAARAAGLNNEKTLSRLRDLERRGEIRSVGKRWSAQAPPSEVAAAMDRLQARTSNLRIVRERVRGG
jgi:hypothetical protein